MIPVELQSGLKKRAEEIFNGVLFKNPHKKEVPLTIFEQNLPQKEEKDISFFPYLVIRLLEGEQKEEGYYSTSLGFFIGTYDDSADHQGHRDVLMIINKLMESLSKKPVIDGRFELKKPIKWMIHDEETEPYYFGGLETIWTLPNFSRTDTEQFV